MKSLHTTSLINFKPTGVYFMENGTKVMPLETATRVYLLISDHRHRRSRDSSVGTEIDYGLNERGSIPGRGKNFLSSPHLSDRLWGTSRLLCNGYRRLFLCGYCGRSVKLNTHFHLVQRSRMLELYLHSTIRLHDMGLS
jgi:hypothetical protein